MHFKTSVNNREWTFIAITSKNRYFVRTMCTSIYCKKLQRSAPGEYRLDMAAANLGHSAPLRTKRDAIEKWKAKVPLQSIRTKLNMSESTLRRISSFAKKNLIFHGQNLLPEGPGGLQAQEAGGCHQEEWQHQKVLVTMLYFQLFQLINANSSINEKNKYQHILYGQFLGCAWQCQGRNGLTSNAVEWKDQY